MELDFFIIWPFFPLVFIFGLIFGSFLNCLIWRLYKGDTIWGRSYCPWCGHKIHWYDNIPVISFLLLKRRCRFCKKKISWQYPLVELLTAIFFLLSFRFNALSGFSVVKLLFDLTLISLLIIVFVFDWRWFLIPVQTLIFGALILLALNLFLGFSVGQLFLAMLIGAGFFALQYLITRGRGLGEGDIWLGGFLGLAFPDIGHLITLFFLTYIIGGLTSIILMSLGLKKMGSKLPLGIFLTISALICLFWAENLINWYLGLIL
ncbi:MAG: prepilin peptidase [Patescibacteria group bacterium]|nr:prepilin peptidase [Patescibacteria group bacterium]